MADLVPIELHGYVSSIMNMLIHSTKREVLPALDWTDRIAQLQERKSDTLHSLERVLDMSIALFKNSTIYFLLPHPSLTPYSTFMYTLVLVHYYSLVV